MRAFPTCRVPLAIVLLGGGAAFAQSDAGPADCALEDGWLPGPAAPTTTTIEGWQAEAAAHDALGSVASFDLSGDDIHVTGVGLAVEAGQSPEALVLPAPPDSVYLFVSDAVVGGQTGTLVVEGPRLTLTGALSAAVSVSSFEAGTEAAPSVVRAGVASESATDLGLALSEEWADARATSTAPKRLLLDLSGLTLAGQTRAMLLGDGGEVALSGPIVVESGGAVYSRVSASLEGSSLSLAGQKLALAGNFSAGSVTVEGGALETVPKMVLVRGGPVVVGAGGASASDVRVTQAFDDERPLLEATLEVVSSRRYLRVAEDDLEYLPIALREAGFQHDALFGGIEVEGCLLVEGEESVQAVVEESWPGFVGIMLATIEASGWAAPIVAVAVIATLPGVMLLDAFVGFLDALGDLFCWFGCPPPPPPPKAYPSWLEPGATAMAELVVHGNAPPGDYPTRVRLLGKNHEPVELDLLVRVGTGTVPEEWRCSIDLYGSYGSCDCGCGAVDPDCAADDVAACEITWCDTSGSRTTGGMPDPEDPTRCWTPPDEWTCPATDFARGDEGCDCGCGALDPDCPTDATAAACTTTRCAPDGSTGGTLVDGSVTTCHVAPPEWVCGAYSYAAGDGSCDCGCGALDPDCPADATVEACDVRFCATDVDPDDLTRCLPPAPEPPPDAGPSASDDEDSDEAPRSCASTAVSSTRAPLGLVGVALLLGLLGVRRRRARARA